MWGVKGQKIIIKELDFIHQLHVFLALSDEEYEKAKKSNPNMRNMPMSFRSMAKVKRETGIMTNLFIKWSEL